MAKGNWGFQARKPVDEPTTRHVEIVIRHYEDGSMSVCGPLNDKAYMISALENALDIARNHRDPRRNIIVPARDVSVQPPGTVLPE